MDNLSLGMVSGQLARSRGLGAWDWEAISNTANDILDIGSKVAMTVQTIKAPAGTTPYIPSSAPYPMLDLEQPEPPKPKMSTWAKVAIGIGGAAVVGGLVYLATRRKGRK